MPEEVEGPEGEDGEDLEAPRLGRRAAEDVVEHGDGVRRGGSRGVSVPSGAAPFGALRRVDLAHFYVDGGGWKISMSVPWKLKHSGVGRRVPGGPRCAYNQTWVCETLRPAGRGSRTGEWRVAWSQAKLGWLQG